MIVSQRLLIWRNQAINIFVAALYAAAQLQMLDSMASSEDDDEDYAPKPSKRELKRIESKKEARKSDKKAKDDKKSDKKGMFVTTC